MRELAISMVIGYFLGAVNPAAAISALKKEDLTSIGTKNLGATNTMLAFGKWYGIFVMVVDIAKAYIAVKAVKLLFPKYALAGLLAGCCAVIGHIYPVFLKFRGGKGLAAFGGLILAYDPVMFLGLLSLGILLIIITDYGISLSVSAAVLGPVWAGVRSRSFAEFLILGIVGGVIVYKHKENLRKIKDGSEMKMREYIKSHLRKEQMDS